MAHREVVTVTNVIIKISHADKPNNHIQVVLDIRRSMITPDLRAVFKANSEISKEINLYRVDKEDPTEIIRMKVNIKTKEQEHLT